MNGEGHQKCPQIDLCQLFARPRGPSGSWEIDWKIENAGAISVQLTAVRLPHGQFKSAEQRFEPAVEVPAGGAAEFTTRVACDEAPGLVTENAFVILSANWLGADWRIFVRIRIVVDARREPKAVAESITTQKVGFSGVAN